MAEQIQKRSGAVDAVPNTATSASPIVSQDKVTVVLVGGFMAPWYSVYPVKTYLWWKGWKDVHIFKYNSVEGTIESHGQDLCDFVVDLASRKPNNAIYFYCTSMGNLVLRCAFQRPNFPTAALRGKHVAVAPPWRGAAWGRFVDHLSIARWISGNGCGKQLRTTALDGFDYMGHHPATLETLVVAGASSYNFFIPRPNDGTVLLDETILRTPHHRLLIPWGMHPLFNVTPSVFLATHQFFMGNVSRFEQHPGLDALEKASKPTAESSKP